MQTLTGDTCNAGCRLVDDTMGASGTGAVGKYNDLSHPELTNDSISTHGINSVGVKDVAASASGGTANRP